MKILNVKKTGNNIRKIIYDSGIDIKDIQVACGFTSRNAIYKWMHGTSVPSVDNLLILSCICNTSMDDIVAYDEIDELQGKENNIAV